MVRSACFDLSIHTWDLAKATGLDTKLDEGVLDFILPNAEAILKREPSKAFAAPVTTGPAASQQDRIIAMTGRAP